jgi:hypothetical protein
MRNVDAGDELIDLVSELIAEAFAARLIPSPSLERLVLGLWPEDVGNPLTFRRVRGETRRGVLDRFPYAISFRLTDEDIVVLAVHGRQDPARWQSRS